MQNPNANPPVPVGSAIAWAPSGTAANLFALAHMARKGAAVVCTNWAHITTDEAAGPEIVSGLKVPSPFFFFFCV
jgi:threonine aldolase